MSDENAESSAATENPEAGASSAETENTATPENKEENRVPQTRFNEVVHERNELREELGSLKDRLGKLETPTVPEPVVVPEPEDKEQAEVKRLVELYSGPHTLNLIQKELGMSLAQAKQVLAKATTASQTSQEIQWHQTCQKHGLDPNDKKVIAVARGFAQTDNNLDIDGVMNMVKEVLPGKASKKPSGASVETDGVSSVMQSSDWVPKDIKDAKAGAMKGKKSKHVSSIDAIRARAAATK